MKIGLIENRNPNRLIGLEAHLAPLCQCRLKIPQFPPIEISPPSPVEISPGA
jgi:hypothetical protein